LLLYNNIYLLNLIVAFRFSFLKNLYNIITPCGRNNAQRNAICSERYFYGNESGFLGNETEGCFLQHNIHEQLFGFVINFYGKVKGLRKFNSIVAPNAVKVKHVYDKRFVYAHKHFGQFVLVVFQAAGGGAFNNVAAVGGIVVQYVNVGVFAVALKANHIVQLKKFGALHARNAEHQQFAVCNSFL